MFAGGGTRTLAVNAGRGDVVDNPKYREVAPSVAVGVRRESARVHRPHTAEDWRRRWLGGGAHLLRGRGYHNFSELRTIAGVTPVLHLNSELKDTFHHLRLRTRS